ncbi:MULTISPECIES: hypothetical protein [Streptomyces]|uniref:hypothetical protein n=1 Tax=Streptomyces TaxID=1883 RepID=UPI0008291E99|nr:MULTISPECIES: hypothetical protein [Streptomyces]OCC11757.1 hypothetical protein A3Q37_02447 [Streptomyces sp. PTY087I2]
MHTALIDDPSWAGVLTPDPGASATLTIEDLDSAPGDTSALFTLCVLAPEPAEIVAA